MAHKPIRLTPKGLENMKEELRFLKEEKRQELSDYMGATIANGDLSESAAYDEARLLQSANEARIADLEVVVERAVVVEAEAGEDAEARLGASIDLKAGDGEEVTFHLVGTLEADILENKVSDESPLGQNLVGRRAGDEVKIGMGARSTVYQVVAVRFE